MLQRHSSRSNRLDKAVLNQRLEGALSYDQIAGYFRSILFEVAEESITKVTGAVRIICNSDLDPQDLVTAAAAQAALRRSWCSGKPEEAPPSALPRYQALYEALRNEKIEGRVLPDSAFGLIHCKAGVAWRADGSATAFLGSVNESASAWKVNYELLWVDNDPETILWVQVALHDEQGAQQLIDRTATTRNPFDVKYSKVEDADWETCESVLNPISVQELLSKEW